MIKTLARLLFLSLLFVALPTRAAITLFGYAGVADQNGNKLGEIQAAGIHTNVATIDFAEVWTSTNLAAITAQYQASGVKAGLFLDNVLFKKFVVSSSQCADAGGPFVFALRGNWQSRLANFATANGPYISTSTTAFLVISTEVNNTCTSLTDVNTAALAVKGYFPGIPTVLGYGRSPGAQPAPAYIPSAIDWVGFYKYGTFDPNNPSHPYNADNQYLVEFNSLLSKLNAQQQVLLVPDGFWATFLHANLNSHLGTGAGWPKWYLGPLAANYETLALGQPKVVGLLFFLWTKPNDPTFLGTKELPQSVRDQHHDIACRNIGCM